MMDAANTAYAKQDRYGGSPTPKAAADRPMTEMENLTANLADTYRSLGRLADNLENRVNGFMQTPTSLAGQTAQPEPPSPQPGTLGSLRYYHDRINSESVRLAKAIETLTGII